MLFVPSSCVEVTNPGSDTIERSTTSPVLIGGLALDNSAGNNKPVEIQFRPNSGVDPAGLLRLKQVLALVPVAASSWWAGVKSGKYPQPIKLGPRTTVWRARDILELIERVSMGSEDRR